MTKPLSVEQKFTHTAVLQLQLNNTQIDLTQLRCELLLQKEHFCRREQHFHFNYQVLCLALMQSAGLLQYSQQRLAEATRCGQYDALTQTLTRSIMQDRLSHAIEVANRQHSQFALLFIDLDHFKPINDTYGHAAGDAVLQQLSQRLSSAIRSSDALSRHGGDEFLLLLADTASPRAAQRFAGKILQLLKAPYAINGYQLNVSASIGISYFPDDGNTATTLINQADAAMYHAKQHGGSRVCLAL